MCVFADLTKEGHTVGTKEEDEVKKKKKNPATLVMNGFNRCGSKDKTTKKKSGEKIKTSQIPKLASRMKRVSVLNAN